MFHCPEENRLPDIERKLYGGRGDAGNGVFEFMGPNARRLFAIASDGEGWEHVSVSIVNRQKRTPSWNEMAWIKSRFWDAEDVVIQYHPRESEYVNHHPGTLHLWRKSGEDFETPDPAFVGPWSEGGNGV